jgi:pimeloyl-ACP methyl ester carboxylesterase
MPHIALSLFFWVACALQGPATSAVATRDAYAELPGVRLWYRDTGGGGQPVVFMHAATGSSRVWDYQIPAFTAAGYRVIAFDRRGFGRTTLAPGGAQPGTAADDLNALMDHLRIDRFHLVGTAAGGFASVDYALSFPQRLRSLVIANSIGGVQDDDYLALGRRIRPPEFSALPADVRELGPSYRASNPDGTTRWMELERTNRSEGPPPPAQTMRNRITFALVETIKTPTLLLTGGADLYAPPPVVQLFVKRIKGSESVVVPEAGHSTYWEQPEAFNRAVLAFIRKH